MPRAAPQIDRGAELERMRITLGLLQSVESNDQQTQRRLAAELGIALGLVNSYLRRCIAKGLLKVSKVPARRYSYYLTRRGFVEKSRLTLQYLSYSFEFFRRARMEYHDIFKDADAQGFRRVALAGASELAEIAMLCALESNTEVIAIVDPAATVKSLVGRPVLASYDQIPGAFDAIIVTDMKTPSETWAACKTRFGKERSLAPPLLGTSSPNDK